MASLIAIDPGTACGWATLKAHGTEQIGAKPKSPKFKREAEPEYYRCGKLWRLLASIARKLDGPYVVVCEGAAGFMKGKHAVRVSNELRGVVKAWCWVNDAKYIEIQPQDLQRFVTGRAQVPKEEMLKRAKKKLGYKGDDDNTADAMWLLEWAKQHAGD